MKKKKKYFILTFIIIILISIFSSVPVNRYYKNMEDDDITCLFAPPPPYYLYKSPFININLEQREEELKKAASEYGLNFEPTTEQDTLTNYFLRSPEFMIDKNSFQSAFYNIHVEKYSFTPDYIDKEHKIAIVFQKNWADYDELGEASSEDILANDTYFQDLINNVKSSQEVKEPFQKENVYTVIYVELNLCNEYHYYGDSEGLLIPYLEKAFESLGYTKKE